MVRLPCLNGVYRGLSPPPVPPAPPAGGLLVPCGWVPKSNGGSRAPIPLAPPGIARCCAHAHHRAMPGGLAPCGLYMLLTLFKIVTLVPAAHLVLVLIYIAEIALIATTMAMSTIKAICIPCSLFFCNPHSSINFKLFHTLWYNSHHV